MKIDFERIKKDSENFKLSASNEYVHTYNEFLKYFSSLKNIKRHNLVIGAHFVYGWMPTVLNLDSSNEKEVLYILNRVKNGDRIAEKDIEMLKHSINNSIIGTSKLLHFICPNKYAIWDSRVCKYICGNVSQYKIQQPKLYLEYLSAIDEIVKNKEFRSIQLKVEEECGYKITSIRAAELIMFEGGRMC